MARSKPKKQKESRAIKQRRRRWLESKGVPPGIARQLGGEDDDVDREEVANRVIEWQRTLPKA